MPSISPDAFWGGIAGTIGTIIVYLLRWYFGRGQREAREKRANEKQKQIVDDSNDRLGRALRDEMRADNEKLRERIRLMETKQATTENNMESLAKSNDALRRENMDLSRRNGEQAQKLTEQASKLASQADRMDEMEKQIFALQEDRLLLIDVLRRAGIPIPPPIAARRPGTGPLNGDEK